MKEEEETLEKRISRSEQNLTLYMRFIQYLQAVTSDQGPAHRRFFFDAL
jgi:hypothetical protein